MSEAVLAALPPEAELTAPPPASRMVVAVAALAGVFLSTYLQLHYTGILGDLACGVTGGCDAVRASEYSSFLGIAVPLWGIAGYLALFVVAIAGLQPALSGRRVLSWILLALGGGAFAFSMYLTALEAFVIHAWCQWCIVSAILATLIFVACLTEIRRLRGSRG